MYRDKLAVLMVGIVIAIGVGLVFFDGVFAQEGEVGLTISPLTFELTANPSESLTNEIKVSNPTENTVSVKMEVEDFTAMGETGQVKVEEIENETYSLKKWVAITPAEFVLEPGGQKFVSFTVEVPENAEPGGKYGSILATLTGAIGPEVTGVAIAQKLGALLLLSVSGEIKEDIVVKEFSAPNFSEYGPIDFNIRFENLGTVHLKPRGLVTVTNLFGKEAANIEFPQQNVLPGAVRKIKASWNENWLWGIKYQATLVGSYGSSNTPFSAVTTFWTFPWKVGLGILVVLVLTIYLTVRIWRKVKKAEEILKKEKMEKEEVKNK